MAFPSVRSSGTGNGSGATQSIALTGLTIESGDLILILAAHDGAGVATYTFDNSTAGTFTQLDSYSNGNVDYECHIKVADGTEDAATLSCTISQSEAHCHIVYVIQDWDGTISNVEIGTAAYGATGHPDAPSLTASWGSADNLWIVFYSAEVGGCDPTAWPTGYTANQLQDANRADAAGAKLAAATRENATATENPSAWTVDDTTADIVANTIVVKPAAGGGSFLTHKGMSGGMQSLSGGLNA